MVEQPRDLGQVQADEIRVKQQGKISWMALAMTVGTRLWLAGEVSEQRDLGLVRRLLGRVRRCAARCPAAGLHRWVSRLPAAPSGKPFVIHDPQASQADRVGRAGKLFRLLRSSSTTCNGAWPGLSVAFWPARPRRSKSSAAARRAARA